MQRQIPKKKRLLKKMGGSEIINGHAYSWSIATGIRRIKEIGFKSKNSGKRAIKSQKQLDCLYAFLRKSI